MMFSHNFLLVVLLSLCIVSHVFGHSWTHCTNYAAVISGQDYDDSQCNGYIREWGTYWNAPSFALDLGINYFASDGAWCQTSFSSDMSTLYSDTYPAANYYDGDTIRIVWPAKNHANYECFNNIPDTSMKLYYSTTKATSRSADPTTLSDWSLYHDFQSGCTAGTDGCGFQNCPSFCDNTDGAPCFGDITFDASSTMFPDGEGYYTFMWYWIFNGGSAAYTTCWEAYVHTSGGDGGAANTASPTERPTRTPTVAGGTYAPSPSPTIDDDDDSSDDSNQVGDDYFIIVPICYDGSEYDADTIIDGANNAFGNNVVDWDIRYHDINDNDETQWNATIQTFTDYSGTVTSGAYSYVDDSSALCDSIENEYDNVGTCTICTPGEIRLYTTDNYDTQEITLPEDETDDNQDNSYKYKYNSVVVVVTMIVLLLFNA